MLISTQTALIILWLRIICLLMYCDFNFRQLIILMSCWLSMLEISVVLTNKFTELGLTSNLGTQVWYNLIGVINFFINIIRERLYYLQTEGEKHLTAGLVSNMANYTKLKFLLALSVLGRHFEPCSLQISHSSHEVACTNTSIHFSQCSLKLMQVNTAIPLYCLGL